LLKLTVPGVPDIYQGAELWDFSMVDPDNRRPVDYEVRKTFLASEEYDKADAAKYLENWRDGRLKLRLISEVLALRRREPQLFEVGSYEALIASGSQADRVCAFMRAKEGTALVVAAALYPFRGNLPDSWANCTLTLQSQGGPQQWTELLSRREFEVSAGSFAARDLFGSLPIALLTRSPVSRG
jgi:(1->4)-alpha-D-glucan 1-alpha-D-glucosylmutase